MPPHTQGTTCFCTRQTVHPCSLLRSWNPSPSLTSLEGKEVKCLCEGHWVSYCQAQGWSSEDSVSPVLVMVLLWADTRHGLLTEDQDWNSAVNKEEQSVFTSRFSSSWLFFLSSLTAPFPKLRETNVFSKDQPNIWMSRVTQGWLHLSITPATETTQTAQILQPRGKKKGRDIEDIEPKGLFFAGLFHAFSSHPTSTAQISSSLSFCTHESSSKCSAAAASADTHSCWFHLSRDTQK